MFDKRRWIKSQVTTFYASAQYTFAVKVIKEKCYFAFWTNNVSAFWKFCPDFLSIRNLPNCDKMIEQYFSQPLRLNFSNRDSTVAM